MGKTAGKAKKKRAHLDTCVCGKPHELAIKVVGWPVFFGFSEVRIADNARGTRHCMVGVVRRITTTALLQPVNWRFVSLGPPYSYPALLRYLSGRPDPC